MAGIMDCLENKYVFNNQDITILVINKIKHCVEIIAAKEKRPFDDVYGEFINSQAYYAIQDPESLMWYENAEFIVDEYYRELEEKQKENHK
jgi:hypothetical protein